MHEKSRAHIRQEFLAPQITQWDGVQCADRTRSNGCHPRKRRGAIQGKMSGELHEHFVQSAAPSWPCR